MQAILVDRSLSGCAFVYGSLSFLDKLACGLALYTIEHFHGLHSTGWMTEMHFIQLGGADFIIACVALSRWS